MPRRIAREHQLGDFWLSFRPDTGKWYITWYDRRLDPATGDYRRVTRRQPGGWERLEEAQGGLAEHVLARPSGPDPAIGALLLNYYDAHGVHVASAEQILISFDHFNAFLESEGVSEQAPVSVLSAQLFRRFIQHRERQGVGGHTISRNLSDVRAALRLAEREQVIARAPYVPDVPKVKKAPARALKLSIEQLGRLYHGAGSSGRTLHLQDALVIIMSTLARTETAIELQATQCDWDEGLVDLNPPGRHLTAKLRPVVPMTDAFRTRFKGREGRLVQYLDEEVGSLKKAWRELRDMLGLPKEATLKTVRHSVATLLRSEKYRAHAFDIQGMLGHANRGGETSDVYATWQPVDAKKIRRQLDRVITAVRSSCDPAEVAEELAAAKKIRNSKGKMVGAARFELATPTMSTYIKPEKPKLFSAMRSRKTG